MKKALIFDTHNNYTIRTSYIQKALIQHGYEVKIFVSDFSHMHKKYIEEKKKDFIYLHAEKYEKNLSVQRMHSYARFAKDCVQKAEEEPDVSLIYVIVPPNSMVKHFAKYKKRHSEVKVWFDVFDMWPETLPVGAKIKKIAAPILNQWRYVRDSYMDCADLITAECQMFQEELQKHTSHPIQTLRLCQKEERIPSFACSLQKEIRFLYCGSINNIIDIDLIVNFLSSLATRRSVFIDIIGGGEQKDSLLQKLQEVQIPYTYHGFVYDAEKKASIYCRDHFGLNIMKESVFVGLTMKSLDYMKYGLPLINTIQGDTWKAVHEEQIGLNIQNRTILDVVDSLLHMTDEQYEQCCKNVHTYFNTALEEKVFQKNVDTILSKWEEQE